MAPSSRLLPALAYLVIFLFYFVHCHNVPVFIWSSKSYTSFPALSALSHVSSEQFSKDYMKQLLNHKNCPVIVFIQDRMSLEDLSLHGNGLTPEGQNFAFLQQHMDKNPSLVLPSVEDPFQALKEKYGRQSIETLNSNEDMHHRLSASKADLTLVYLPQTVGLTNRPEALKSNDELMNKALNHIGTKNYIAIFTGKEPSWDAASEEASHQRISRSLLASVDVPDNFLLNWTHVFIYAQNASLSVAQAESKQNATQETIAWPPTGNSSVVDNTTLEIEMKFTATAPFKDLLLKFFLYHSEEYGFWETLNMTLRLDDETYNLKTNKPITASSGFSFSCGRTTFYNVNTTLLSIAFTLDNFQMEPYPQSNTSFSQSFHCSTWFTLPIWMGFFTILLFTAILGMAIFMLFQVKTMDRFDDPKGKTITVPLSE